jgi:hypothetical protein
MRWLPENVSTFGGEIDRLFYLIYYITGAVFLLVTVLLALSLILYRRREGRRAVYSHGNTALELTLNLLEAREHPVARAAKDVAAGGVFLMILASVAVGILLFGPRLMAILQG